MMRSSIKLLGALLVGFVGVANADQVIVYEGPLDWDQQISASFAVNRQLGRAWVDVDVRPRVSGSEALFASPIQSQVDGLYYDSARKQVLYRAATGPIVCAEDGTGTSLKSTGDCRLILSTERRRVDDGFDVHEQTVAKVVLDAQSATALQASAPRR
jgi:hypothetical protein